jgi:hypothetical protein
MLTHMPIDAIPFAAVKCDMEVLFSLCMLRTFGQHWKQGLLDFLIAVSWSLGLYLQSRKFTWLETALPYVCCRE